MLLQLTALALALKLAKVYKPCALQLQIKKTGLTEGAGDSSIYAWNAI